jgi:hypothetical protein
MRVLDIITENKKVVEAPAGALSQIGRKIGAKALGAAGFKGKAAELTGKADVGAKANQLMIDFRGYLGRTGGNFKQVQAPQLAAFLKSKGYPDAHLNGVQGIMTTKQVDQAVLKAAQTAEPGSTTPSNRSSNRQSSTAPSPSNRSSSRQSSAAPSGGVAPATLRKITSLKPQQKKQLAGMLASTAGAPANLLALADEIKKGGPTVINAVNAMLSANTRTGGRVAGQLSTNPRAVKRRQANAAKRAGGNP